MAGIAILGYGTVGSGVYEALGQNRERLKQIAGSAPYVKRILDIREFPGDPAADLITGNFNEILNDGDIRVIVECMGGIEPAYGYTRSAIERGKHVITSNKEVVSLYGPELLALAAKHSVSYLFDASVAGVIPIIRPLTQILSTDVITEIKGILNGTTNYILSQMDNGKESFEQALKKAAAHGYAERDPSDDIDGLDTSRKLAILLSLTLGLHVDYRKIRTEGIRNITEDDIHFAGRFGYTLKLLAVGKIDSSESVTAITAPFLVKGDSVLSAVRNALNAVVVSGKCMDDVMMYGLGAGKLPTGAAIISDIVYAVAHEGKNIPHIWSQEPAAINPWEVTPYQRMVRISCLAGLDPDIIYRHFTRASGVIKDESKKQLVFFTPHMTEAEFANTLGEMTTRENSLALLSAIRISEAS